MVSAFPIIMLVCLVLCTGINYLLLKRTDQNRNGLLLGVTLPPEAAALPEVQSILQKYKRQLQAVCLFCCAVGVLLLFLKDTQARVFLWMDFFLLSMALPYLPSLGAGKALKALRDAKGWPADPEDEGWKLQLFYCNPADKRITVPKRVGVGTTINFGTVWGKIYAVFIAVILAAILLLGPVVGVIDRTPVRLEVTSEQQLIALHGKQEKYTIPTGSITDVELYPFLPENFRVKGIDLDHYWQGTFTMLHDGKVYICLDPTAEKFLRVETEDSIYWFTAETPEQTQTMYEWLQSPENRES